MENKPDLTALRKRYPQNFPIPPDKLDERKLLLILEQELNEWEIVASSLPENPSQSRVELFREYMFSTFEQVLEFMTKIAPVCNTLPHHPRWENTWTTLKVFLSTWDSNHIITYKDIMMARHMEKVFHDQYQSVNNLHSSKRKENEIKEFASKIEALVQRGNLSEAFRWLNQYVSQPNDIVKRTRIEGLISKYYQFTNDVVQNNPSESKVRKQKKFFEKQLAQIVKLLKIKPKVFFSYAWGGPSEIMVDQLYKSLDADGNFELIRDKINLGYKGLISDFIRTIGRGKLVIIVLSEKYLKSEYCMFELYELYRNNKLDNEQLLRKIFPIRAEEIDFSNEKFIKSIESYWKNLVQKTKKLAHRYPERYDRANSIEHELSKLIGLLRDINSLTVEKLSKNDFAEIKKALNRRFSKIS